MDRQRHSETRRSLETGEEREFRRSLDRRRHRETRTTLTDIEREAELTSDRVRHRMKRHRISEVDIDTVYYLGQMCQYCESLRFPNEQRNCCHNGKVSLTQLCEYPESLKELLMVPHKIQLILEITSEIIIVHLHLHHLELM